jgi:hypothetical protein
MPKSGATGRASAFMEDEGSAGANADLPERIFAATHDSYLRADWVHQISVGSQKSFMAYLCICRSAWYAIDSDDEKGNPMQAMFVLTFEPQELVIENRKTGAWAAGKRRVLQHKYVVCARNRHHPQSPGDGIPHCSPFLIGEIDTYERTGIYADNGVERLAIRLSRYALLPHAEGYSWPGKNPVRYTDLSDFGVRLEGLEWIDFMPSPDEGPSSGTLEEAVKKAKEIVASAYKVPTSAVQINITV